MEGICSISYGLYILIIIIAVFLPAIGHDQFFFFGVQSISEVPIELILSPVFYMVLSVVTLIFGTRILKSTIKLERSVNSPDQETKQLSKFPAKKKAGELQVKRSGFACCLPFLFV